MVKKISASAFREARYDPERRILAIILADDTSIGYASVPPEIYYQFPASETAQAFWMNAIRGHFLQVAALDLNLEPPDILVNKRLRTGEIRHIRINSKRLEIALCWEGSGGTRVYPVTYNLTAICPPGQGIMQFWKDHLAGIIFSQVDCEECRPKDSRDLKKWKDRYEQEEPSPEA